MFQSQSQGVDIGCFEGESCTHNKIHKEFLVMTRVITHLKNPDLPSQNGNELHYSCSGRGL
jgi:hypothetical protein